MKSWTISWARASFSAVLVVGLAGCVTAKGSVSALPPLKQYSLEFQRKLKQEQPTVRACCPNTSTVVKDYGVLRAQVRAGQAVHAKAQQKKGGLFGGLFK